MKENKSKVHIYKVIHNPSNWFTKHEVWFSGIAPVMTGDGYLVDKHVVKKINSYKTQERAEAAIQYQQDIKAFREMSL